MNWLRQEFDRARKRSAQLPPFARPTAGSKEVEDWGAVLCPICQEFAATLNIDARQLNGDVLFVHRGCLPELAARMQVLDREFPGWKGKP